MLAGAKAIIEKNVSATDKIGVAVSGGADSMCLLHLLLSLKWLDKKNVTVINIDHCIRGNESRLDSEFVRDFCDKKGIKLRFKKIDIPLLAKESGLGEEACARNARRDFFETVLAEEGLKYVLLAHHKRDQAETLLLHMFRGCGIKGLVGMTEINGIYLRPLIGTQKELINEYLKEKNIEIVEDSTNQLSDYSRNYVRNEILPIIRKKFPFAEESLYSLSELAAQDELFISSKVDRKKIRQINKNAVSVDVSAFSNVALGQRYIFEALKTLGEEADVERKHVELILGLVRSKNGSRLTIKKNLVVVKEYRVVTFVSGENGANVDYKNSELAFSSVIKTRCTDFCGYRIFLTPAGKAVVEGANDFFLGTGTKSRKLYFDVSKVPLDAVIRFRKTGDSFVPFGGKFKKLKKYLIDKKIPLRIRDNIPLLCYNDKALVILGEEISESVKVDKSTNTAESIMCVWLERI